LILLYDVRSQQFAILLFQCLVYGVLASVFCFVADFPIVGIIFGAATLIGAVLLAVRIVQRLTIYRRTFENWKPVEVSLTRVRHESFNELTVEGKYEAGDQIVFFFTKVPLWMRTITLEPGDKLTALIDPQELSQVSQLNRYTPTSQVILRDLTTSNWGKEAHISWSRINPIDYLPLRQWPYNVAFYLGLVGLVIGLYLFIEMGNFGLELNASQNWPSTNGTISYRYINTTVLSEKDSRGTSTPYTMYCPEIGYRYQVEGIELSDDTYELGSECDRSSTWASEVLAQYQVGDPVVVYYNPEMPSEAILHKKQWSGSDNFFMVLALVVIILPSLGAMLFAMIFGLLNRLRQSIEWEGH